MMNASIPLLFFVFILAGCRETHTEDILDTYHERLTNVLDIHHQPLPISDFIHLPDTRTLLVPIEDIRISLLNAYELRSCGLFQLVAERNSVLGKIQDPTRQLKYEILFINGLKRCLATPELPIKLTEQLTDILTTKHTQLTDRLHNMLLTDKEWRQQFSIYPIAFDHNQFHGFIENIQAIQLVSLIHESADKKQPFDELWAENLTQSQEAIHPYRYFGQLFYSMVRMTDALNQITSVLSTEQHRIQCGKNRNQQQARYLGNVFYRYFIHELQPYLAKLDTQYQEVQPSLMTVFNQARHQDHFTPYYRFYIAGDLHEAYRQAIYSHQQFWLQLFQRCEMNIREFQGANDKQIAQLATN